MEERGALCGENQGYQEAAKPEQIGLSSLGGSFPFVISSFTLMLLVHWILSLVHLYSKYAGTAHVCTNNYLMRTLFPR